MMDTTLGLELLVIGVLLVIASGVGLLWLRISRPPQIQLQVRLLLRVRHLSQEFSGLVRHLPANPGEPYASHLAAVGKSLRQGWERCHHVEAKLQLRPPEIFPEPAWRLALVVPLFGEMGLRVLEWLELAGLWFETRRTEKDLAETQRRLAEIAGLGKAERRALEQLQANIKTLQDELKGHPLTTTLSKERQKLDELAEGLSRAMASLDEKDPTPAQVTTIHPERLKSEQALVQIRLALRAHEDHHERLHPRMNQQRQWLEAFEQALALEEARQPAPLLHERTLGTRQMLTQQAEALERGEYDRVVPGTAELSLRLKELEETLKKLSGLRTRLKAAQEKTGTALAELRQWMRSFPPPFVLDSAQEQARALQSKLQEQNRAAALEDPAELEQACQLALADIHKSQENFERNLEQYRRLAIRLTPEAVEGLQKRGAHLASRLKQRHPGYQEKACLSQMEEHLAHLAESWQAITAADPNRQSDLLGLGTNLSQMENAWNELERDIHHAQEVVEQIRTQQERAVAWLEDEAFGELPPLAQLEDPAWGAGAGTLLEQHHQLVERSGHGDEDFSLVLNEAAQLQKTAAKLVKEYKFQLARAQAETSQSVQALNACADRLERLVEHPVLEFDERAVGILNEIRIWLGQAQTQAGLERRTALAGQGAQLRMEAELICRGLEGEQAAVEQDRAWTEDQLVTAEEYQGAARQRQGPNTFNGELAAARNLLETARRKLAALSTPRRKYRAAEYQAELADVREMIHGARAHVDNAPE